MITITQISKTLGSGLGGVVEGATNVDLAITCSISGKQNSSPSRLGDSLVIRSISFQNPR